MRTKNMGIVVLKEITFRREKEKCAKTKSKRSWILISISARMKIVTIHCLETKGFIPKIL